MLYTKQDNYLECDMTTKSAVPPQAPLTLTVFHGTDRQFERFSLDYAARPGMNPNGHLGVWLAMDRELAQRFGALCLEVNLTVDRPYWMSIRELMTLNDRCHRELWRDRDRELTEQESAEIGKQFYREYREQLLRQGYDTIYLVEKDDRVDMIIALCPDRLVIQ